MLSFALFWGCCAGTEAADIYNPSGQWVTNVTAGNGGNAIALTLPSSGIYTILVYNVGYGNVGGYALSVQSRIGGGCNSKSLACGQTVTTNTSFNTQMDAYSYTGTAGQMLSFALFWGCCAGTEAADIYNPSGQWVTNVTAGNGGNAIALTLPSSGIYTILVHNVGYGNAGGYALSVQSLTDGGCGGTNLLCGGTINSNIVGHAEVDAIAVPGGAGAAAIFSF